MRIQFDLDQAMVVLKRLEGGVSNVSDGPKVLAASIILKEAITKEINSNSARIGKVIETMERSGYDERVVLDLKAAQDRMKSDDNERKNQFKIDPKKGK
jgi:hypothetical protein